MPESEIDLLAVDKGSITAPAGCGKTHLICEALKNNKNKKPILVLTHTNAGVKALKERLDRARVSPSSYRLSTIDGWSIRLVSTFPQRSDSEESLLLQNPRIDYPNIRVAAFKLLKAGHINDIISSSYSKLIVDEYQDCSIRQHAIVYYASQILSTCLLGDPMQSIFGFGDDRLAKWEDEVCKDFPVVAELNTPWRWINSNKEDLGHWLLEVRKKLISSEKIDLSTAPSSVKWIHLDGREDYKKQIQACLTKPPRTDGKTIIIGDSTNPSSQRNFAKSIPGAITVEAVDLRDLVQFANTFDLTAGDALEKIVNFAQDVMRNVGANDLLQRVKSIENETARKSPSEAEASAISFNKDPSYKNALTLLEHIARQGGVTAHRPEVLRNCINAFNVCSKTNERTFYEVVISIREQQRVRGRSLPKRAVGSTLLVKGLEAEAVVILSADQLNANNLYVALTRATMSLVVCSKSSILNPD